MTVQGDGADRRVLVGPFCFSEQLTGGDAFWVVPPEAFELPENRCAELRAELY